MLNDSPVGCQTRAMTEPQRDGGICEANDGEVVKTVTFKPLSRARKERAPGIPRGMMRGKALCASPLMQSRRVFRLGQKWDLTGAGCCAMRNGG